MIIICPSKKGHYKNYVSIIKRYVDVHEIIFHEHRWSLSNKNLIKKLKNENEIIFLNGEFHWFLILVARFINRKSDIKAIFYYAFAQEKVFIYRLFSRFYFFLLYMLKIRVYGLEVGLYDRPVGMVYLPDPCVCPGAKKYEEGPVGASGTKRFLVAGYIDERKSIIEIIEVLKTIEEDLNAGIELTIVGEQDPKIESFLAAETKKAVYNINIVNRRVSDDELFNFMLDSNCILAIYKKHYGSSGFVVNSFSLGIPILFVPVGVLSNFRSAINFDALPVSANEKDIEKSIRAFLEYRSNFYNLDELYKFRDSHSVVNFIKVLFGEVYTSKFDSNL